MVHFKVTDGSQTRKLEAPSGVTYEGLKKKLSSLFPDAVKENSDLVLHYRDADGDVITLSSDQEFQEVLSTTEDLKFSLPKSATYRKTQRNGFKNPSLHSLWCQGYNCSSTSLADIFDKELHEVSQLLDALATPTSIEAAATSKPSSQQSHVSNTPGAETTTGANIPLQTEAGNDDEVRSKPTKPPTSSGEQVPAKSSSSEDKEVKLKPDAKEVPSKEGASSWEYCIYEGLAPLLLSDILFHPPAPRSIGHHITWSPCGLQCAC